MVLCNGESRGRNSRLSSLFLSFFPAGYFRHEAFTLSVSPVSLHSTAHQRRNRNREQGNRHILPKPDCKQGCSCCLTLPHRRFLFWCQGCFFSCEPMSQIESKLWITLNYDSLLSFPHLGQRPERIFGDAMRQFNKTVYSPRHPTGVFFCCCFFQSNTCLVYGLTSTGFLCKDC